MNYNLAFNVGITGHRILTQNQTKAIYKYIEQILRLINEIFKNQYSMDNVSLSLFTALAEGSDRIAVKVVLDNGLNYKIQCALPMNREEYIKDFDSDDSKNEFRELISKAERVLEIDNEGKNKITCYYDAGIIMLENIDLLIGVWDEEPPRGLGGTGHIVNLAQSRGIKVLCINSLILDKIKVLENYIEVKESWDKNLENYILERIIAQSNRKLVDDYEKEIIKEKESFYLYDKLIKVLLINKQKKEHGKNERKSIMPFSYFTDEEYINKYYSDSIKEYINPFLVEYKRADNLAIHYGNIYKTLSLIRALLPLAATFGLALGFYWKLGNGINAVNSIGFFLQAVFLYLIICITNLNNKKLWHKKFYEYRILAELFRQAIYMVPLGYGVCNQNTFSNEVEWYKSYYINVLRNCGLPNLRLDTSMINKNFKAVKEQIVLMQQQYHKNSAEKFEKVFYNLTKVGNFFFYMGIIVTIIRFIVYYLVYKDVLPQAYGDIKINTIMNLFSLLLPAIGAGVFAVQFQCGFKNLMEKHSIMYKNLEKVYSEIDRDMENYNKVVTCIIKVSEICLKEVSEWGSFIKSKRIDKV